ncbi:MAG: HAD-IIA family hydrolase [Chloroflexota bacterium]
MTGHVAAADDALARLRAARAWVFDMDGVLYVGTRTLPGVAELLDALRLRGRGVMMATNNSMSTPEMYTRKLAAMGIDVPPSAILTSALATRDYLERELPGGSGLFVIGMPALREQLFADGSFHPVQFGEEKAAALVLGLDKEFTYDKLKAATSAIWEGARFIATNTDATLPTETGLVPGAGSIVAAIRTASGVEPTVIGKPETPMLEMALIRLGVQPHEAVMVGDRLDTDILAGRRAGMLTVLVLTGVSGRDEIAGAAAMPDVVANDLPSLTAALIGG